MSAIPINGMTLNKELRDKQMTGVGMMNDALGLIAECEDAGEWPGYAPEVQCLNLPAWVYGRAQ